MSFFSKTLIEHYSAIAASDLKEALYTHRENRPANGREFRLIRRHSPRELRAVSHESRMAWTKALAKGVADLLCRPDTVDARTPIYLVTICDVSFTQSVTAPAIDLKKCKARLCRRLKQASYLGAIEPAYYSDLGTGSRVKGRRCVHWHLHALVWDVDPATFRQYLDEIEDASIYKAIAPGFKGVHGKLVADGGLPGAFGYCFKMPAVAYRLQRTRVGYRGRSYDVFKQRKSKLRPGEHVKIVHLMKNVALDDLVVAGGDGRTIVRAAEGRLKRQFPNL